MKYSSADPTIILRDVRNYITKGWCQGSLAKDSQGAPIDENDPNACQWCLIGAIRASVFKRGIRDNYFVDYIYGYIWRHTIVKPHGGIASYNDSPNTTHQSVLAVLDDLIDEAEGVPNDILARAMQIWHSSYAK
jgi:hypothetical protein